MNRFSKYSAVVVFSFAFLFSFCQTTTEREKGWKDDIDYLLAMVKKFHYVYSREPLPQQMMDLTNKIKSSISEYSDERMLIELERMMFYLGDGHSYILPVGSKIKAHCVPLKFYQFSDGLFVVDAYSEFKHLIGYKVIRAGPVEPKIFMRDMESYVSQDNKIGALWIGPYFFRLRGMFEAYGLQKAASNVKFEMEDRDGKKQSIEIPFVEFQRERGIPKLVASQLPSAIPSPIYLQNVSENYWMRMLPEKQVLYIQYNQVFNGGGETIEAFARRVSDTVKSNKPRALIVDVRHNNGGNGELNEPLVKLLENFETSAPTGRIIVITGRNTFSAAQLFIAQVDKRTKAVFAGEPSSSKPNFVGEEFPVTLPWSGAMGSISNRYHENIPGDKRIWIEPEIKVSLSSVAYFANHDPVLDAILKTL